MVRPHREVRPGLQLGESAIAPDAVGHPVTHGLHVPFYFEYELRARHPRGVLAHLRPYERYYWSNEHKDDQPPFPTTLFVVDTEEIEDTYVRAHRRPHEPDVAAHIRVLPARFVQHGDTGTVMASTVGAGVPETAPVQAERLPVGLALPRMRHRPVEGIDSDDTSPSPHYAVWGVQIAVGG